MIGYDLKASQKKLAYIINVDWYFSLHWLDRARAAQAGGFDVHVLTRFTDRRIREELTRLGFTCHDVYLDRKSMNPFKDLRTVRDLYRLLARLKPHLVHCVTVKPNIYGGFAARLLNLPAILNVTGLGLAFSGRTGRTLLSRQIIKRLYKVAANRDCCRIVFENSDDRDMFVRLGLGKKEQLQVIPGSGVDLDLFRPAPEPDTDRPTILFAARLLWDKGLNDLIDAAELLQRQGYSFRLDVAGIIDEASQNAIPVEQVRRWHEDAKINWLGEVREMPQLLRDVHIVALPTSYGEGVPRILLEGAATARPLVATDISGCRDIVRDGFNGLLVPPRSPARLAAALGRLLDDPKRRRQFGRRGRRLVEEIFDREKVIEENRRLYRLMSMVD